MVETLPRLARTLTLGRPAFLAALCLAATGCATATEGTRPRPSRTPVPPATSTPATPTPEAPPPLVKPTPPRPAVQTGKASWYGDAHHGKKTASGEAYDMHELTAAHRSLPLGTRVRVINVENDRAVVVRINDRGPFVRGRIIDLSRAAARELGPLGSGVFTVRIEVLEDAAGEGPPSAERR